MEFDEKFQAATRLHAYLREWRGRILNLVSVHDLYLAQIISKFFASDKRYELFLSEIATNNALGLRRKIDLLQTILKHDPQLGNVRDFDLIKELQKIAGFRNVVAHSVADVSEAALQRDPKVGVGFVFYDDGERKTKVVSEADFNDWSGKMGTVAGALADIKRLLGLPPDHEA